MKNKISGNDSMSGDGNASGVGTTIRRWNECEDWVEFVTTRELARTIEGDYEALVNFGGPGGATPYYFYVRVRDDAENVISDVTVEGVAFEASQGEIAVKGTPPGFRWIYLGLVKTERNYRRVTLCAPRGLYGFDRLCVLQIPRRLESGEIERRISRDGMPKEPLSGVPLGGVGAGKIEFCRDGLFRNITINGNIDTPILRSEGTFFAVRAECGRKSLGRIVSSEHMHGLAPFESLSFIGCYPKATLTATDRFFPLNVIVQASGAVIPRNVRDSSLPAALFRVRLTAKEAPVKATVAFSMENFLGCGGSVAKVGQRVSFDEGYYHLWEERSGNAERQWESGAAHGLRFDGGVKEEKRTEGRYVLATNGKVHSQLTGWRYLNDNAPWLRFIDTGLLSDTDDTASSGEATAGAIAVEVELAAGETRDITFVFSWHMPYFWQANDIDYSHFYCNEFASADEVSQYVLQNFARLEHESEEMPLLLAASTLPSWFSRSLCNDAYIFSTATWLTRDGRFSVNESPSHMFGCMGTIDQKLYANHYNTLFFPELDRTELLAFARTQGENGGIQHDLGYGHIEQSKKPHGWPDLSSSLVILSLKHYQLTGDKEYMDEVYPHLVKALDYQFDMDTDGDGIANISGVGNTFDAEKYEGTSSYLATLWLAALRALEELARRRGDAAVGERCRARFAQAKASAIDELWNGEYFVNYYDAANKRRCPNSHFSQLAGEFFARTCGLGPLYGDHYVRQALSSMLRLNYHPRLKFPANEATPEGNMPVRKMWGWLPHARVFLAGTPLYFGMAEKGWHVLERLEKVIADINNDNRWDQRLFFEPDTGREHWGRFYMTAAATWYAYQALLGYRWDKPEGVLSLCPNLPDGMMPFEGPIFLPDMWLWLSINRDRTRMSVKVVKRFGNELLVNMLCLPSAPGSIVVAVDDEVASICQAASPEEGAESRYRCKIDLYRKTSVKIEFM
ncbi:MAG: GH116 family glycosyl-hydrolase [Victivallales bacterium]